MATPDWWLDEIDVELVQGGFDLVFGTDGTLDVDIETNEYIIEIATEGLQGTPGPAGGRGPSGTQPTFTLAWDLEVMAGQSRLYLEEDRTIAKVRASVDQAPVGSAAVVDVKKNGSSLFTNPANRPTIAPGTNTAIAVPDIVAVATGDYLTVDVVAVGSTYPGGWLTVTVTFD